MLVPFSSLPDHARLWIYQSNRKFNLEEISIISEVLASFTKEWEAHGAPLLASFEIRFDRVIILAADEKSHAASGCSIDDSVRNIKGLGERLGIDFFDRTQIAFHSEQGVITVPLPELKQAYDQGKWDHQSLFINTLVNTKGELENSLLVPASSTWLKRYLPREKVAG